MAAKRQACGSGRQAGQAKLRSSPSTSCSPHQVTGRVSAVLSNYVMVIGQLMREEEEARPTAFARRLGVSHVTAIKGITRLRARDLARARPYRSVFLTPEGMELARTIGHRRGIVAATLMKLGVTPEVTHQDACCMEHSISQQALEVFAAILRRRDAAIPDRLGVGAEGAETGISQTPHRAACGGQLRRATSDACQPACERSPASRR